MKYKLFNDLAAWTTKSDALETYLGIPDGKGTTRYCRPRQVINPETEDYEKYVMPVGSAGRWKCDDQFDPADLVDYDPTWYPPIAPDECGFLQPF